MKTKAAWHVPMIRKMTSKRWKMTLIRGRWRDPMRFKPWHQNKSCWEFSLLHYSSIGLWALTFGHFRVLSCCQMYVCRGKVNGHDLCHLRRVVDTPTPWPGSRDHGFLEGLSCNVPKKHFRITSYQTTMENDKMILFSDCFITYVVFVRYLEKSAVAYHF